MVAIIGQAFIAEKTVQATATDYHLEIIEGAGAEDDGLSVGITIANPKDETLILDYQGLVVGSELADELEADSEQPIEVTVNTEKDQIAIKLQQSDQAVQIKGSLKKAKVDIETVGELRLSIEGNVIDELTFYQYEDLKEEVIADPELQVPDQQLVPEEITQETSTKANTSVSSWEEFEAAVLDETTTVIQLTADIANPSPTSNPHVGTLIKSLEIIGMDDHGQAANRVINFGDSARASGSGIFLSNDITSPATLSLKNIEFRGRGSRNSDNRYKNALLYSDEGNNRWSVNFENFVYDKGHGNTKRIMYAPTAAVTFRGTNNLIASDYGAAPSSATGQLSVRTDWQRMFEVRSFVLTDKADLKVDLVDMLFFSTFSGSNRENGAQFRVENGSTLEGDNKNTPIIAVEGSYFNFYVGVDESSEPSTIDLNGTTKYRNRYGGLICVEGPNAHYSVSNGSLLDLDGRWSPVTVMMSEYGVFDVDDGSTFNASVQSDNGYTLGGTIRFRRKGHMTFNIKNKSVLRIEKDDINADGQQASANKAAAIRMYGGDNNVNISGESKVYIRNHSNQYAIQYVTSGSQRNAFNLKDAKSMIDIDSYRSGGIKSDYAMDITAESGTVFQVASAGRDYTFDYGKNSRLEFDNMLYYDFRNNNKTRVFDGNGVLRSIESDMSVWRTGGGTNLDGDPSRAFTMGIAGFSGSHFDTVESHFNVELIPGKVGTSFATTPEISDFFGAKDNRMRNYARVSGNNAYPIADELRVPTNADKYIHGHISVPEGIEGIRDAWTEEVTVEVKVTKPDATSYILTGKTIGVSESSDGESVYGDPARGGIFKIENIIDGSTEFLETGSTIEILRAWRGIGQPEDGQVHVATPATDDRWVQDVVKTVDVTPPDLPTPVVEENRVTNVSKTLSGSNADPGSLGYIGVKNAASEATDEPAFLSETFTVESDGTWAVTVADYFVAGQKVSIFFKDNAGKAVVINPPTTNDDIGNINPYQDLAYHDATFTGVTEYTVEDAMPTIDIEKSVISSSEDGSTSVGDQLTYTIVVKNSRNDEVVSTLNEVKVTDVIPNGLKLDNATITGTINGTAIDASDYAYDESSKTLTFDVGTLLSEESATIEFTTVVEGEAYDKVITNTTVAEGKTIPGDILTDTASVVNPGGAVRGSVEIIKAPSSIDFGSIEYRARDIRVNEATIVGDDLEVSDTRGVGGETAWEVKAAVTQPMTLQGGTHTLKNALHYQYEEKDLMLLEDSGTTIYKKVSGGSQNISSGWSEDGDGLKLDIKALDASKLGNYQGIITWTLEVSPS